MKLSHRSQKKSKIMNNLHIKDLVEKLFRKTNAIETVYNLQSRFCTEYSLVLISVTSLEMMKYICGIVTFVFKYLTFCLNTVNYLRVTYVVFTNIFFRCKHYFLSSLNRYRDLDIRNFDKNISDVY